MNQVATERMRRLLAEVARTEDCRVFPAVGQPEIREPHLMPPDMVAFYSQAGGAVLFENLDFPALILPPERVVEANPLIVGQQVDDDISSSWYTIVEDLNGDYLTIDLERSRLGRCYDSFWDSHGVPGSCAIVATSFSDLLRRLLDNRGGHWYWLEPGFQRLGDAYNAPGESAPFV
jgi:hypothetical protein